MCIAIIKPLNVDWPTKERLSICFDNNPHSIGYGLGTLEHNNKLIFKFKDFEEFYNSLINTNPYNVVAFIHFRYATHGEINLRNCQPFYISDKQDASQNKQLMMHNGVFLLGKLSDNKSDSLTFAEKMYNENLVIDNNKIIKSNNKIAIMSDNGAFKMFGKWIKNEDGCFYSNGSYRKSINVYKEKYNNDDLNFCDCCGEIGENYLTTEVGYHFCSECINSNKVYLYNCRECGEICTDEICSVCSEDKDISLNYWL